MPGDNNNLEPQKEENAEINENSELNEERFESDTQKIIHRHLQNENDVITDEDISGVRVGMTPPELDDATEARFEDEETKDEVEEKYLDKENNEDENMEDEPITPWDTIDPAK